MEPRTWKYKRMRKKNYKKLIVLLGVVMSYIFFSFFLKSLPVSYAWFNAASSSKGDIINSTTADLIRIKPEKIIYAKKGIIKTKIVIQNISDIKIPLKVDLMLNNQLLDSNSTVLIKNDIFSPGWKEISEIPFETKEIQYRIIGFDGYIDEVITISVDKDKVKATISPNNVEPQMKEVEKNQVKSADTKQTPSEVKIDQVQEQNSTKKDTDKSLAPIQKWKQLYNYYFKVLD